MEKLFKQSAPSRPDKELLMRPQHADPGSLSICLRVGAGEMSSVTHQALPRFKVQIVPSTVKMNERVSDPPCFAADGRPQTAAL